MLTMRITRKQFGALALSTLALSTAWAQGGYPSRTVTFVVPAAAGGTTDISARMAAQALAPVLGQAVVVDNKGGGNGAIAANIVKRAEHDGYTLLMQYSGYHVISPHLTKAPQWEQKDFQPIANVISAPQIIVVREGLPVKSLAELVAYAKANPGKLNYASSGNGSLQHVTGAMLEQLGGQVDLTFGTAPPFMPHIAAGKLRVLAVTGKERLASLPDVPTTAEAGYPGVNATSWFALFAPAGVPKPVIDKLAADMKKVVEDPAFRKKAQEQRSEEHTSELQSPLNLVCRLLL